MTPQIKTTSEIRLAGHKSQMSFAQNQTEQLWQQFMPRVAEIPHRQGSDLYSVEIYPGPDFFQEFDPGRRFEKWAAIRVSQAENLPPGISTLVIPAGRYAVFPYQGAASEASKAYQHIYAHWLPASSYQLDHRPHFAVMGANYSAQDPKAKEKIWIPIRNQ